MRLIGIPVGPSPPSLRRHTDAPSHAATAELVTKELFDQQNPESAIAASSHATRFGFLFRRSSQGEASTIKDVEIYYGSMTGTAERLSRGLSLNVMGRGIRAQVMSLEDFDEEMFAAPERLKETRLFVFIVATHFAGAPSPSAERFHNWLRELCEQSHQESHPSTPKSSEVSNGGDNTGRRQSLSGFLRWIGGTPSLHRLPSQSSHRRRLGGMQYAVFGVGDSTYLTFNAMGKYVEAKVAYLGGTKFYPTGLGDVSKDIDAMFAKWTKHLLHRLPFQPQSAKIVNVRAPSPMHQMELQLDPSVIDNRDSSIATSHESPPRPTYLDNFGRTVRLRFRCAIVDAETTAEASIAQMEPQTISGRRNSRPLRSSRSLRNFRSPRRPRTPRGTLFRHQPCAELVSLVKLSPNPKRNEVGLLRLKLINPDVQFDCGDTVALYPQNSDEEVEYIGRAFGYDLDSWIELTHEGSTDQFAQDQLPFPTPCTIRTALSEYLELRTVTREFLRIASGFVSNPAEGDRLEFLASTDGSKAFQDEILDKFSGIIGIFQIAPSLKIPLEVFVNIAQQLQPRYYTIASSPLVSKREFDLAISLGRPGSSCGLAVAYFRNLVLQVPVPSVTLRGFLSASLFRIPDDPTAAMIMIANGVGVGPMRALLQHRLHDVTSPTGSEGIIQSTTNLLFLGCSEQSSVVFGEDLQNWSDRGHLKLVLAISDDPACPRQHVQDSVDAHLSTIVEAINSNPAAKIFVCGKAAMAMQVRTIFLKNQESEERNWFDKLHQRGGYVEEAFG